MIRIESDAEFRQLCSRGEGFIYNDFSEKGPGGKDYNILHRASCHWVNRSNLNVPKYFSPNLDEAVAWLCHYRGEERVNWKCCGTCLAGANSVPRSTARREPDWLRQTGEGIGDLQDSLTLQTGITIKGCRAKLAEFCEKDFSYRKYDLPSEVLEDNDLTESDVQFANHMVARMAPYVIKSIISRREAIDAALSLIPPGTSMSDENIPWPAIKDLFDATLGPEVGPPRATKILHKKRPALIPILDSVVISYCEAASPNVLDINKASRMTTYLKVIKCDIDTNLDVLTQSIQTCGLRITPVRAFDILIWGYSGEYERLFYKPPLWKR